MGPCSTLDNMGILLSSNSTVSGKKKCISDDTSSHSSPRTPHSPPHSEITLSGGELQSSDDTDAFLVSMHMIYCGIVTNAKNTLLLVLSFHPLIRFSSICIHFRWEELCQRPR